jgi:tetratricopeptide (TPR) repeat protein
LGKDPSYAPAFQGLATVWLVRQQMGITPPREAGPKAKAAALRAVELDDHSAEAHEALAMVRMHVDWDWAAAEHESKQVLEINPNSAHTHAYYAHLLAVLMRSDESFSHSRRALELDPFNALYRGMYAMVLYIARRYDDALAAVRAGLAIHPDNPVLWNTLQQLYASMGMHDELVAARRQRIAHDAELLEAFEGGLAESGDRGAHRCVADLMAHRYESRGRGDAFGVARRYVEAGDVEKAVDWLERAYEERDPNLLYIASLPFYDPLRPDPRFQDLARRMNLPQG